jgi:hypothetical protein
MSATTATATLLAKVTEINNGRRVAGVGYRGEGQGGDEEHAHWENRAIAILKSTVVNAQRCWFKPISSWVAAMPCW